MRVVVDTEQQELNIDRLGSLEGCGRQLFSIILGFMLLLLS